MKPFNFDNIIDQKPVNDQVSAGNYVCTVKKSEDVEAREYVVLTMEIVPGCAESGKQFAYYLSYKDSAAQMLKRRLKSFTESNPGFDAEAAWNGSRPELFLGKSVGVTFNEEEWRGDDGTIRVGTKAGDMVNAFDVANGRAKEPRRKLYPKGWGPLGVPGEEMARQESGGAQQGATGQMYAVDFGGIDVPF